MIKYLFLTLTLLLVTQLAFSQDHKPQYTKALTLMDEGKFNEAKIILDDLLDKNPEKLEILYNVAYCYFMIGRADITTNHMRRFFMRNKKDPDALNLYGLSFEKTGYDDSSIVYYNKTIEVDKNYYEAYFNRGRWYLKYNLVDSAIADFNYAKKNKIMNPNLYFTTGEMYYKLYEFDKALNDLEKIVDYFKDNIKFYGLIGDCYYLSSKGDEKKLNKAIEYYTRLLRIDSNNISVLKNRALAFEGIGAIEKAEQDNALLNKIKLEIGFNPQNINWHKLVSKDNFFSIELPIQWKTLISENEDTDIILFFDTTFYYEKLSDTKWDYDVGGVITYYSKIFEYDPDDMASNFALRDQTNDRYLKNRQERHTGENVAIRELMRKNYAPNENNIKELYTLNLLDEETEKIHFITEFFQVSTTGKLLSVTIWVPQDKSFLFENIIKYITDSIKTED